HTGTRAFSPHITRCHAFPLSPAHGNKVSFPTSSPSSFCPPFSPSSITLACDSGARGPFSAAVAKHMADLYGPRTVFQATDCKYCRRPCECDENDKQNNLPNPQEDSCC
ncbi:unnamed protein product, partial [Ectocarpus sp. 12 AP-2014]